MLLLVIVGHFCTAFAQSAPPGVLLAGQDLFQVPSRHAQGPLQRAPELLIASFLATASTLLLAKYLLHRQSPAALQENALYSADGNVLLVPGSDGNLVL